jgi:hypothetical protein
MRQLGIGSKPKPAGHAGAEHKKSAAAAALMAAKAAASVAGAQAAGTVTVAETRRFAGQTITVNREVAKDSREAQRAAAAADTAAAERKRAGLDAVLASLQQAKKVGRSPRGGLSCTACRLWGPMLPPCAAPATRLPWRARARHPPPPRSPCWTSPGPTGRTSRSRTTQ